MYKSSRVSHRKPARKKNLIQQPVNNKVEDSENINQSENIKKMDDIPTFDEFLTPEADMDSERDLIDENCPKVKLYFQPRVILPPVEVKPLQQQQQHPATKTATSGETPLYSPLPSISLKTNPAPANILNDFGKAIGKGLGKGMKKAMDVTAPLTEGVASVIQPQVVSVNAHSPPAPTVAATPRKKIELELILENSQPKFVFEESLVLVLYPEALIFGKNVSQPGEEELGVEVQGAVLIKGGNGTETKNQNGSTLDINLLPRYIFDVPGTLNVNLDAVHHVEFNMEENKTEFLNKFSLFCEKYGGRGRHEVIRGTIWSAVLTEDLDALTRFTSPEEVNAPDHVAKTALHYAASISEGGQAVSILLGNQAEVNVLDNDLASPLHLAAKNGNVLAVHSLLRVGADADTDDLEDKTPFFWAAEKSCLCKDVTSTEPFVQVMEALVEIGKCNVDDRNTQGKNVLHVCVDDLEGGARVETIGILLKSPIFMDPSSTYGELGRTCLHIIAVSKLEDDPAALQIATVLLDNGARPNACDTRGDTPLMLCLRGDFQAPYPFMIESRTKFANLLVRYGARLDVTNSHGTSPAEAAKVQRVNFDDSLARWSAKREPTQVATLAKDAKLMWNLPKVADKDIANRLVISASTRYSVNQSTVIPWLNESDCHNCSGCHKPFVGFLQRKYRCRHCSMIFCNQCTSKTFTMCPPIAQAASVTPIKEKVCDSCFNGLSTRVERAGAALIRLNQDREAMKKKHEEDSRMLLGLAPPASMDQGETDQVQTSTGKANVVLQAANKAMNSLGERGDKLHSLNDKTAKMRDNAADFADMTRKLREKEEKNASLWPF